MHRLKSLPVVLLCIVALMLAAAAYPTSAVDSTPGEPGGFPEIKRADHRVPDQPQEPAGGSPAQVLSPSSLSGTGGPDWYGYMWDDSVPFSWIDATSGTDVGLGDEEWPDLAGPINLPFPFRFYEDTYTQIWIAPYGYITFSEDYYIDSQQDPFPNVRRPNKLVAPFWTVIALSNSSPDGRVYYHSGGSAPNRYFVVEWHNVAGGKPSDSSDGDETYRFEVVFYENGDILFQYHTMTYNDWRFYASIGIEDPYGDGLGYMDWSNYWDRLPASGDAVLFKYPVAAARVNVTPAYYGDFSHAGGENEFWIPIRNTGELGGDTYDLFITSSWPASLYADDGVTPLTDNDGDGVVDTGVVGQGSVSTIVARIDVPIGTDVGSSNTTTLNVRSSLDIAENKNVSLSSTVPSSFAQVYQDSTDGAISLYLATPGGQAVKMVSSDQVYSADDGAIVEAPDNNFLTVWSNHRGLDTATGYVSAREIYFTLINHYGDVILPASKLTDFSNAVYNSFDRDPAVAVTLDGHFGVLWYRYLYDTTNDLRNYNVYLAILDSSGNLVSTPINITNNSAWGSWDDPGVPEYRNPRIAATTDNRFVLSWERDMFDGSNYLEDISYAIYDANGSVIKGPTQLTNSAISGTYYYDPGLSALAGNRVIVLYSSYSLLYSILDSSGNLVKSETSLSSSGYAPDAVQLSGGNILVAWTHWDDKQKIQYAIFSGNSFEMIHGPFWLSNPASITGDGYASIASDADGNGILTWAEVDWDFAYNLYYALIAGDGAVLTEPVIFRSIPPDMYSYLVTNWQGYGNTSYSWVPPDGVDLSISTSGDLTGGQAGGGASVGVTYANQSAGAVSGVAITATLGVSLTYLGDNSGIVPIITGDQVVWNMPDLSFLEKRPFALYIGVPANASLGELFPVQIEASCEGLEATPEDNEDSIDIMVSRQIYLPQISR